MGKFKGTWIAIAVFGALLAYLLIAKPKTVEERKTASLTVAKSERETIDKIEFTNAGGSFTVARISGGPTPTPSPLASGVPTPAPVPEVWKITAPRELPLDDTALNQMRNALSELVAVDSVWKSATPEQIKQVGLDAPVATVTWHAKDGEHGLLVGKPFPKNDQVYVAAKGSTAVFVARKFGVEIFSKGLDDLRRKKTFDLDRDEVRSISIESVKGKTKETFSATRTDVFGPWRATSPFLGRADKGKLNNLIAKLGNLRADSFPAPDAAQGLDAPRFTVQIGLADGSSRKLLIGADVPGGKWFARDPAAEGPIVTSAPLLADLADPFGAWRDKALLDFPPDMVDSLELTYGGTTLKLKRDDTRMWVTPTDPPKIVNGEAAQFLRGFKSATIAERVEDGNAARYGFDKPVLSASWIAAGAKTEVVVGAAKDKSRWVRTSESPAALRVDDDLINAAKSLIEASARPAAVTGSNGAATMATPKAG